MVFRPGTRREALGESAISRSGEREPRQLLVTLRPGHCCTFQQMEDENGHYERFFSPAAAPTTATYIELLSAAGLVASAARGEQQPCTLCTFDNTHSSNFEVLSITCDLPVLINAFASTMRHYLFDLTELAFYRLSTILNATQRNTNSNSIESLVLVPAKYLDLP
jgi:hypothetical protein